MSTSVVQWILHAEARHLSSRDFIAQLVERLHREGFPVARLVFTLRTMHPEVWLESVRWSRSAGAYLHHRPHTFEQEPLFSQSPVVRMYAGESGFRCRLNEALEPGAYPILFELKEEGHTDYLIAPLELAPNFWSYVSCSTDAPDGFSEANLALWEQLLPSLAATVADKSNRLAMSSLLDTYIGVKASQYVRGGQFRRGDRESLDAVIWFCDLRGFTAFADANPPELVLARLDRYFDLVGSTLGKYGGEILKFIGDAILAIFPVDTLVGEQSAAETGLRAAREVTERLAETSSDPGGALHLSIGLHAGKVTFGNVGTARRLDFTVIGGPVNEAARIEALCKPLHHSVLFSARIAKHATSEHIMFVGTHALRGVCTDHRLFTFAPDAKIETGMRERDASGLT